MYQPLCKNKRGREAIDKYGYKPFIDHSVRREPNFESEYPGITSICRGRNFAPRLKVNDTIAYITGPGRYGGMKETHYRLVAILQVIYKFPNHQSAANWYMQQGLALPLNCMIEGNHPLRYDHTIHTPQSAIGAEEAYIQRVANNSDYIVCKPLKIELENPPIIPKDKLEDATGFTPSTTRGLLNPGDDNITENHLSILTKMF
ncbi:hypothetical protein JFU13_28460 [Peribacillus sp. TH24]|nr:hypothetical protein [Peribacillus sp. TH24]